MNTPATAIGQLILKSKLPSSLTTSCADICSSQRSSVPFAKHQIPKEAEERARGFLRETMPHLADRPFSFARICWCADTPNRAFLISKHPEYPSLVLGCGASGHGFCHIPVIGGL